MVKEQKKGLSWTQFFIITLCIFTILGYCIIDSFHNRIEEPENQP